MSQFHSLTITDIRKETPECVSIAFHVPEKLTDQFKFDSGQNITLKLKIDNEELRRSYSICSSPHENELRVAVKQIPAGKFSSHANQQFKIGDTIEVMPPSGRFGIKHDRQSHPTEEETHQHEITQKPLSDAAGGGIKELSRLRCRQWHHPCHINN